MSNSFVLNLLSKPVEYTDEEISMNRIDNSCVLKGYFNGDLEKLNEDNVDLLINQDELLNFFSRAGYSNLVVTQDYQHPGETGANYPRYIRISFQEGGSD